MILYDKVTCRYYIKDDESLLQSLLLELQKENKELKQEINKLKSEKRGSDNKTVFLSFFDTSIPSIYYEVRAKTTHIECILRELKDRFNWEIEDVEYEDKTDICVCFSSKDEKEVSIHAFINDSGHFDSSIKMNGDFDVFEYDCFNTIHSYIRKRMRDEADFDHWY